MIQLSGAGKRFGHKLLFENVDWLITNRDHIGVVGGNGTGKSTLMKMLAGLASPDEGEVIGARELTFGYLPQDGLFARGRTVFAECMSVFDDVRAMEQELESLMHSMAELDHTSPEYAAVADRYERVEHEFRTRDGYSIEAEVGRVLMGLGFGKEDWQRQTDEFSGALRALRSAGRCFHQSVNSPFLPVLICDFDESVSEGEHQITGFELYRTLPIFRIGEQSNGWTAPFEAVH